MMQADTIIERDMLEAFLALEDHDAHVRRRRSVLAAEQAGEVKTSVEARRAMWGATGVVNTEGAPRLAVVETALLDNPDSTPGVRELEEARRPGDDRNGKAYVERNQLTVIGGLARFRKAKAGQDTRGRRFPHHEQAAAWLKAAYEAAYGSAGGAVDPSNEPVDTSARAHDSGMAARVDNGRELYGVFSQIGPVATNLLVAVIVMDAPIDHVAPIGPNGRVHWRVVQEWRDLLLGYLDKVAEMRGFATRGTR